MDPQICEIDQGSSYIGYREACERIRANLRPLDSELIALELSLHRIAAEDVFALISYPSTDISLKDGFAVNSADVDQASPERPKPLKIIGSAFAGTKFHGRVPAGSAVSICSGASIPAGADAVVAAEFCDPASEHEVCVRANAGAGRNILRSGGEVKAGDIVIRAGKAFLPGTMGLAAAAGISRVKVCRRPKTAIIGIGDEIVAPGKVLQSGEVYASNLITLKGWLDSFGIECSTSLVRDRAEAISLELAQKQNGFDVILTSGGAWGSERDLAIRALEALGWREVFHHVRMGPGKGISFGIWNGLPVFCLPGGPASNEMAFLQLALPGILLMSGIPRHPLQSVSATLTEEVRGRHKAWTEYKDGLLSRDPLGKYEVAPYRSRSRLQAIAGANCLICVAEGTDVLRRGETVPVQVLPPRLDMA